MPHPYQLRIVPNKKSREQMANLLPGRDSCDRDVARPQLGDLLRCNLARFALARDGKVQSHVVLGEGHSADETLSVSRHQS